MQTIHGTLIEGMGTLHVHVSNTTRYYKLKMYVGIIVRRILCREGCACTKELRIKNV